VSILAVGIILAQIPTGKCEKPFTYASKLLTNAKKNYTTTKRQTFPMVYALHKFRHYLLGHKFVFYINHMALLYLVRKPQLLRQIVRWLLLFLEYSFLAVYKPGCSHLVANFHSQLPNATKNLGVTNRTHDASIFILQPE
jgi:hypothetical protein